MKIGTNLILLGILSMLVGTAFASPLLISELERVPFWTVPEGPKAEFSINVKYADFTLQENASDRVVAGHRLSILDYYIVLNVTNHSDLPAEVSEFNFVAAKDITVIPSALGGFFGTHKGGMHSNNFGPAEGYAGHVGAARVEGIWLDGEWINDTWVPEGGLQEIWRSEDIFPPEGLEEIWKPDVYPPANVISGNKEAIPFTSYGGSTSNNTNYYTYSGTIFNVEGDNYWIEGVPLKEYIVNNEVKSTIIYYNGSWIDVTDRIEVQERPYVSASNTLLQIKTYFRQSKRNNSGSSGISHALSESDVSHTSLAGGFNNIWAPHQSRLILLTGTVNVESWKESLNDGKITLYTGIANFLNDQLVDGTYVNTYSSATELETVQLEITEDGYLYNTILSDNQMFVTDSFGVEVFIEPRS